MSLVIPVARYEGMQRCGGFMPDFQLWTLMVDLPCHPYGSTVSRKSVEAAGFDLPLTPVVGDVARGVLFPQASETHSRGAIVRPAARSACAVKSRRPAPFPSPR